MSSVIKLEASESKPDLVVEYKGKEYILPGNIDSEYLEEMLASKNDEPTIIEIFLRRICPADFKKVLAPADIPQLAKIWGEYVNAPKESNSNE
jgi:hypothetical protein